MRKLLALCALATASLGLAAIAGATANGSDTLVTNGSPPATHTSGRSRRAKAACSHG